MDSSSDEMFNRERTVYEILGGGVVAAVILLKKKNVSVGLVNSDITATWMVFASFLYTIYALVSSVLLLWFSVLFLWSKSASIPKY